MIFLTSGSQSEVPRAAESAAAPVNVLEIQNLRPHPRPSKSEGWEWGLVVSILTYSPMYVK